MSDTCPTETTSCTPEAYAALQSELDAVKAKTKQWQSKMRERDEQMRAALQQNIDQLAAKNIQLDEAAQQTASLHARVHQLERDLVDVAEREIARTRAADDAASTQIQGYKAAAESARAALEAERLHVAQLEREASPDAFLSGEGVHCIERVVATRGVITQTFALMCSGAGPCRWFDEAVVSAVRGHIGSIRTLQERHAEEIRDLTARHDAALAAANAEAAELSGQCAAGAGAVREVDVLRVAVTEAKEAAAEREAAHAAAAAGAAAALEMERSRARALEAQAEASAALRQQLEGRVQELEAYNALAREALTQLESSVAATAATPAAVLSTAVVPDHVSVEVDATATTADAATSTALTPGEGGSVSTRHAMDTLMDAELKARALASDVAILALEAFYSCGLAPSPQGRNDFHAAVSDCGVQTDEVAAPANAEARRAAESLAALLAPRETTARPRPPMEAAASTSSLDATMVELPRTPSAVVPPALPADSGDFAAALRNADATLQSRGTQQSLRDKERELERAQQVARQLRSEVQELTLAVAASRRREAQLREEAEEADRSRRRAVDALGGPEASAPPEYVKHVLLRFASGTPQVRRALVPALAQVLHLSTTEAASVTQACTME